MKRKIFILIVILVVAPVSGVVQADEDERPAECVGEPTNIEALENQYDADATGIAGTINSPANLDVDAVSLKTDATTDGDSTDVFYITIFHTDLGNENNNIMINISSAAAVGEMNNVEWVGDGNSKLTLSNPEQNASFRLVDDSFSDNICLKISANDPEEITYDWKLTISQNNENQWYPAPKAATQTVTPTPSSTPQAQTVTSVPTRTPTSTEASTDTPSSSQTAPPTTVVEETVENTSSEQVPGFGLGTGAIAIVIGVLIALRQM